MSTEQVKKTAKEKKQISIATIKELLNAGKNRKEIAEHFGAPKTVIDGFFKHPELQGLRPKRVSEWELVPGETEAPAASTETTQAIPADAEVVEIVVEGTENTGEEAPAENAEVPAAEQAQQD